MSCDSVYTTENRLLQLSEAKDIIQQSNVPAIDEEEIERNVEALRSRGGGGSGGKPSRMRGGRGKSGSAKSVSNR